MGFYGPVAYTDFWSCMVVVGGLKRGYKSPQKVFKTILKDLIIPSFLDRHTPNSLNL